MDRQDPKYMYMYYPYFEIGKDGIIPHVTLPPDYLELVPGFYKSNGVAEIERYKDEIAEGLRRANVLEVRRDLNWDSRKGLRNISLGTHGGYDLDESGWHSFCPHNLSTRNSIPAFCIATRYISELLKERTEIDKMKKQD